MDLKIDVEATEAFWFFVMFAMSAAMTWKVWRDEDKKIDLLTLGLKSTRADDLNSFFNSIVMCFVTKATWSGVTVCLFSLFVTSAITAIIKAIAANF